MHWLLGGYLWLFVHRPFEIYPLLGDIQLERGYMLLLLAWWVVTPNKAWLPNRLHAAFFAFTCALVLCWFASPYRDRCWDAVENYLKCALFTFLVVTTVRDEKGLRRLLALYLVAVGLYMTHSMREYLAGRYEWRQGISRMIGVDVTYRDPNAFASTLLLALPLTLPFYGRATTFWKRLPLYLFTGCASLCIILTGSRTGFVGLGCFGLLCLLLSRSRAKMVILLGGVALLSVVLMPGYLQDRFLTLVDPSYGPRNAQESVEGRLGGFVEGVRLWGENPLVGVGPGAFALASGGGFQAHNVYGQVMSEMGAVGVVAFLGVLGCFLANWLETRKLCRRRPERARDFLYQTSRSVAVCVLLLLFTGWAGHNLYRYNWLWLGAFQLIALHCLRERAALGARQAVRAPHWLPRAAAAVRAVRLRRSLARGPTPR
jgi:O-antigen ligase